MLHEDQLIYLDFLDKLLKFVIHAAVVSSIYVLCKRVKVRIQKINHAISHITKKGGTYESYRT